MPFVGVPLLSDLLLSTALKRNTLLLEAYFSGTQSTSRAAELCVLLWRRDAWHIHCGADHPESLYGCDTQHKLVLCPQDLPSQSRHLAAEEAHEVQLRGVDARTVELTATVQKPDDALPELEAALHWQKTAQNAEVRQRVQHARESALEFLALQRAGSQPTACWMTLQGCLQRAAERLRRTQRTASGPTGSTGIFSRSC
ncbi:hypothetical protein ABL78_2029 [Leptomonas seymouri]|uniref:Uncharacterized protein n=1 Tax=Leptomonas seymouri TaxID=5684 RepID=A0A0N1PDM5_LEPSE|nr:hypothetical protein ABL78_2029 [Leptomonas seymouri]|eukprot:KPI88835.1 hypothetical protein ABL78_2029 [Leptomonas seymouri]